MWVLWKWKECLTCAHGLWDWIWLDSNHHPLPILTKKEKQREKKSNRRTTKSENKRKRWFWTRTHQIYIDRNMAVLNIVVLVPFSTQSRWLLCHPHRRILYTHREWKARIFYFIYMLNVYSRAHERLWFYLCCVRVWVGVLACIYFHKYPYTRVHSDLWGFDSEHIQSLSHDTLLKAHCNQYKMENKNEKLRERSGAYFIRIYSIRISLAHTRKKDRREKKAPNIIYVWGEHGEQHIQFKINRSDSRSGRQAAVAPAHTSGRQAESNVCREQAQHQNCCSTHNNNHFIHRGEKSIMLKYLSLIWALLLLPCTRFLIWCIKKERSAHRICSVLFSLPYSFFPIFNYFLFFLLLADSVCFKIKGTHTDGDGDKLTKLSISLIIAIPLNPWSFFTFLLSSLTHTLSERDTLNLIVNF